MSELNRAGGARRFAESGLLQFQPEGNHVELDESSQADAPGKRCRTEASRTVGSGVGGTGQSESIADSGQKFSEARNKAPDHVCPGSKKNRGGAARSLGKMESCQADEVILRCTREYGFMPKKKITSALSKFTEVEQDLLARLEHGYRLETDSLGGNPVLRTVKDNELLRPADANASTVKALEERGLIRRAKGPDPLTIAWHLTKKAK